VITWGDLGNSFWLAGFLFLISFILFLVIYLVARILYRPPGLGARGRSLTLAGLQIGLPLGFTGMVAGFLTGASREPAVTALIPAILTFVGLILVYMIGKSPLRSVISGFAVFVFSLELLVGSVLGTASRDRNDEYLASVDMQRKRADQEFAVRRYRSALGLPPEPAKPTPPVAHPEKP
jgi:hypothetical protein